MHLTVYTHKINDQINRETNAEAAYWVLNTDQAASAEREK